MELFARTQKRMDYIYRMDKLHVRIFALENA